MLTPRRVALGALIGLAGLGPGAATGLATRSQVAMLEDTSLLADPSGAVAAAQALGAQQERLYLSWRRIAPGGNSRRRPRHFRAADPAAYPSDAWRPWDQAIVALKSAGLAV